MFFGKDLIVWLLLALGGALFFGVANEMMNKSRPVANREKALTSHDQSNTINKKKLNPAETAALKNCSKPNIFAFSSYRSLVLYSWLMLLK